MQWRIWGVIPVTKQSGLLLLDMAARVRWLGEAIYFPYALRPNDYLHWEAVDGNPNSKLFLP
jgi:hypothetical protein